MWEFSQNLHNLDCNWSTVKCHKQCFAIILFVTRFFQPSHNTKREARDFSALKRLKNTAGRRASGKNVFDLVSVLVQIRDILSCEARHYEINIFVLNRLSSLNGTVGLIHTKYFLS